MHFQRYISAPMCCLVLLLGVYTYILNYYIHLIVYDTAHHPVVVTSAKCCKWL